MTDREPLQARDLQVRYETDAAPILAGLSLAVRLGDVVGVVGPNGSGKSTLVRALSRALRPAHGAVLLAGQDLYSERSARDSARQIGVVPQDTQVAFDFSVREVVEMGRAPRLARRPFAAPAPEDARAVREALHLAGITHLAERAIMTLSGGERQRTLLARALAQEPDVLLLDEPTAHLDLRHQAETLALVRTLAHEGGKAVLSVLHDLNLASAFCDRLILLHRGRIAAQGTPQEVLTTANLRQVYGVRVWVRRHPLTRRPWLLTLPDEVDDPHDAPRRSVHVLCGGGSGTPLLFALTQCGYGVTAGGPSLGDTDAEACDLLHVPYARAAPFSPLSRAVMAEIARLAAAADAVTLAPVAFGPTNLTLLETALAARRAGKPVVVLTPSEAPFAARDFTGGVAAGLWEQLLAAGALAASDLDAAMAAIDAVFE